VIGETGYDKKGDITRPDYVMYVWKKDAAARSPTSRSTTRAL
jgi:branched-chain amino acid transport system substrate-binding protein